MNLNCCGLPYHVCSTICSQVIILGGGFAGPVLALSLKTRGITSAIYELREEGAKQGGNIALAPNALRVLDILGVYDEVRLSGYSYDFVTVANAKGQQLGEFMNGSPTKYNYPAVRIHRRDVRDILLAKLSAEGIPIYYDKKFSHVVGETGEHVRVAFEDNTEATGDYLVGCDGIHSRVRRYIYPSSDPVFAGAIGMMGTVFPDQLTDVLGPLGHQETKRWPVSLPQVNLGGSGMFATIPPDFAGTEFGIITVQSTKEHTREGWCQLENDKIELKAMTERAFLLEKGGFDYPPEVRLLVERIRPETLSSWPFYSVPETPTWFSAHRRVIFIGDAAHAIPPTGAQGAAMAFEDAATLALTQSRTYRPNPMPDVHTGAPVLGRAELLDRWCMHRKDRIKRVRDFTIRNGELMSSTPFPIRQAMKDWVLWATLKLSGPSAGAEWIYNYHCESVLGALVA